MANAPLTVAACDAKIDEINAELDRLRGVPKRGRVGKGAVDLRGMRDDLKEDLEFYQDCRAALLRGGVCSDRRDA